MGLAGAGIGVVLIGVGLLLALFGSQTAGIILIVVGALALVLGFATSGWGRARRDDVVVVRDRAPLRRRRRVIREDRDLL